MNPILKRHLAAKEYVLFGQPEVNWSHVYDGTKGDLGESEGFWAVWADYAPDTRCGFAGDCRCREMFIQGCDTEEEATILAATLKAEAREVR